jgi:hypothetical protein
LDLSGVSVRLRLVIASILLGVGIGLPWFAFSENGAPWEFQDRAAVVLSTTGTVEIYPGTERPRDKGEAKIAAAPGVALFASDEVRVGSFAQAQLRTRAGDLTLGDGAQAVMRDDAVSLARGLLLLEVPETAESFRVGALGAGADVRLLPGRYRFTADGHDSLWVLVVAGEASTGEHIAKSGQLLEVRKGPRVSVAEAPKELRLTAGVDKQADEIRGTAAQGAAVYLNGKLSFVDAEGTFRQPVPPGDGPIVLFARDPAGNTARKRYKRPKRGLLIEDTSAEESDDDDDAAPAGGGVKK